MWLRPVRRMNLVAYICDTAMLLREMGGGYLLITHVQMHVKHTMSVFFFFSFLEHYETQFSTVGFNKKMQSWYGHRNACDRMHSSCMTNLGQPEAMCIRHAWPGVGQMRRLHWPILYPMSRSFETKRDITVGHNSDIWISSTSEVPLGSSRFMCSVHSHLQHFQNLSSNG